jgi:hypothetical protein
MAEVVLPELADRVRKLEASLTRLEDVLSVQDQRIRMDGLRRGANGVTAGFLLAAFVFAGNAAFKYVKQTELISETTYLILCAIISASLVFYFGFIFRFAIRGRVTHDGVDVTSSKA